MRYAGSSGDAGGAPSRCALTLEKEGLVDLHAVADDLQSVLVEVIDLSLTSKQASWILARPPFDALSAELDDLAADAWEWADAVGARLAVMGVAPDGRVGTVAEQVRFPSFPGGFVDDAEALAQIVVRLNELIEECPRRMAPLRERDPVSENLLIGMTAGLVKHRWLLVYQDPDVSSPSGFAARCPRTARG
jgi:starvation-inducible DNA-binding protein